MSIALAFISIKPLTTAVIAVNAIPMLLTTLSNVPIAEDKAPTMPTAALPPLKNTLNPPRPSCTANLAIGAAAIT